MAFLQAGILQAGRNKIEAGLEVEGVRMETPKKLVVSFKERNSESLEQFSSLVETVIDMDLEPTLWEVEM